MKPMRDTPTPAGKTVLLTVLIEGKFPTVRVSISWRSWYSSSARTGLRTLRLGGLCT